MKTSTHRRIRATTITNQYLDESMRKAKDPGPEPYDGHLKTFGNGARSIDMGSKY